MAAFKAGKLKRFKRMRSQYGTLPKCVTLSFDSMQEAERLLKNERALHWHANPQEPRPV